MIHEAQQIWQAALGELQLKLPRPSYETWLRETKGISFADGSFVVGVSTPFAAEWLEKRMYTLIQNTVAGIVGCPVDVQFQIFPGEPNAGGNGHSYGNPPNGYRQPSYYDVLNQRYTFDSFVVGKCNQFAHAASVAVSEGAGQSYNPLFLYSDVGLGKTHLLQAISHRMKVRGLSFIYTSAEQFTNEFVSAIRERSMDALKARYSGVDMLLVDDIQFMIGKVQTQEGFFHIFNTLHNTDRQMVIASDRPPSGLTFLTDRLQSRFGWGLTVNIEAPEYETKKAILWARTESLGCRSPEGLIDLLAGLEWRSIRELEGSINRLVAYSQLTQTPLSTGLAEQLLAKPAEPDRRAKLTPAILIEQVASHFSLSAQDVQGKSRQRQHTLARQMAMYLLREELHLTLAKIGELLGNRDHTMVRYNYRGVQERLRSDDALCKNLSQIKALLTDFSR